METNDKTHVFAAEQGTAKEWMETMCDIAFQVASPPQITRFQSRSVTVHKSVCLQPQAGCGGGGTPIANANGGPEELQMSENLIYYSREEGKAARGVPTAPSSGGQRQHSGVFSRQ